MRDIDEMIFDENMDLANSRDEAAISHLWMEHGFDHASGRYLEWCPSSRKLIPKRRVKRKTVDVCDFLDKEEWSVEIGDEQIIGQLNQE